MNPPGRPPVFCDPVYGRETTAPDTGELVGRLIDSLADDARDWPHWVIEADSGLPVRLTMPAHEPGRSARIGFAAQGVEGVIEAVPDPSGWLLATAKIGGAEVFRAYVDRPFEEYALWPAGADAGPDEEEPGRVGKKRWWLGLSAAAWPVLSPLARDGWFNACHAERRNA